MGEATSAGVSWGRAKMTKVDLEARATLVAKLKWQKAPLAARMTSVKVARMTVGKATLVANLTWVRAPLVVRMIPVKVGRAALAAKTIPGMVVKVVTSAAMSLGKAKMTKVDLEARATLVAKLKQVKATLVARVTLVA